MKPARQFRLVLILAGVFLLGVAVVLVLWANQNRVDLFYSPTDIASGAAPTERTIRAGGLVVPGSVSRDPDSLQVQFSISDNESVVDVRFEGILPDLFREGQGIVATGSLNDEGKVLASEVLAKHDENYMSPEVARALEDARKRKMMPHE